MYPIPERYGLFPGRGNLLATVCYESLKNLIESSLEANLAVYQEYHALLVAHARLYYRRKPHGKGDVLLHPGTISGKTEMNGR